jgi:hypothetical protein
MIFGKIGLVIGCSLSLAACGAEPIAVSHQHVTEDGSHWSVQITMYTGVPNTPVQTVMVIYNQYNHAPIAMVSGQSKPMGEQLVSDLLAVVASVGPAAVTGKYILRAAEAECPTGTLCGTLVQVNASAGANAGADSSSVLNN